MKVSLIPQAHPSWALYSKESGKKPVKQKEQGQRASSLPVDLRICHDFIWLKWKKELGYVYGTIKLSFKPKDSATLKL